MVKAVFLKFIRLEIPLHGEHLGHAVRDRCARGEDDASTAVHGLNVAHLEIHIESPFAGGLRQSGDARHLREIKQILEVVRLVHKNAVHTKFLESQRVVLFVLRGQSLKFGFEPLLCLFKFLNQTTIGTVGVFPSNHFQLVKLFVEETLLRVLGQRDALET